MPTHTLQPSPLFKATPNAHPLSIGYALGWYSDPHFIPGEIMISHGGGLPGVGTVIAFLPNHDFGIVLAGNSGNANLLIEAVTKELMGRRVGWSEEKRRKHYDDEAKKKAKEAEAKAAAKEKEMNDIPGPGPAGNKVAESTPSMSFDDIAYKGKYHHPAYGTFTVGPSTPASALSAEKPTLESRIMLRPKPDPKEKSKPKSTTPPIIVTPHGRRGLVFRFLLHPPTSDTANNPPGILPVSVEWAISHAEFSECAFPELDEGWADPESEVWPGPKVEDREGIWETTPAKVGAGALEFEVEEKGKQRRVRRLGLRLARVEDPPDEVDEEDEEEGEGEDGGKGEANGTVEAKKAEKPELEDGWENRMVWFTRVLDE